MFELADRLGQPLQVILDMTVSEFQHWFTFLKLKDERLKESMKNVSKR
jgi:hypothetical protein